MTVLNEVIQRIKRLFDRRGRVKTVELIKIDMIELQAAQALLALLMMWYRELPREFTPAVPVSPKTFVATTTFSRGTFRFFSAWPVISSDRPSE